MVMVYDLIKTKFGHLTFEEIREAMKMYVTNSFSDIKVFRLLDCVAIGEILTAYVDFRNEATFIYRDKKSKLLAQTTDLTKDEKDSIVWGGVNRIFKEYKETNVIDEPNEYIFDFLAEKGLIKLASESTPLLDAYYKQKIYQAKKDLLRENRPLQATNKSDVIDLENITKHIKDGTSPKIFIRAKHLVLKDYFDKNIDNNEIV